MSETSVATSGEAQKAALARRERLLESEGAVYEVLVMEGISQRYSTRTHFESLGKGEAERIFNESVPHSRVCLVTRRAYEGIWPARRAVDTPSWHQIYLPPTRWHGVALDAWVAQLYPDIEPSVVCGGDLLQRTPGGWELT